MPIIAERVESFLSKGIMNFMIKKRCLLILLGLMTIVSFIFSDEDSEPVQTFPPNAIINASYKGDEEMVRAILAAGVDKDVRDALGGTALHVSIYQQNLNVIRLLLQNGFDPNVKSTKNGSTPLHYAVATNNLAAAKLLLQYGADISIRNNEGFSPVEKARREGKAAMLKALL